MNFHTMLIGESTAALRRLLDQSLMFVERTLKSVKTMVFLRKTPLIFSIHIILQYWLRSVVCIVFSSSYLHPAKRAIGYESRFQG